MDLQPILGQIYNLTGTIDSEVVHEVLRSWLVVERRFTWNQAGQQTVVYKRNLMKCLLDIAMAIEGQYEFSLISFHHIRDSIFKVRLVKVTELTEVEEAIKGLILDNKMCYYIDVEVDLQGLSFKILEKSWV